MQADRIAMQLYSPCALASQRSVSLDGPVALVIGTVDSQHGRVDPGENQIKVVQLGPGQPHGTPRTGRIRTQQRGVGVLARAHPLVSIQDELRQGSRITTGTRYQARVSIRVRPCHGCIGIIAVLAGFKGVAIESGGRYPARSEWCLRSRRVHRADTRVDLRYTLLATNMNGRGSSICHRRSPNSPRTLVRIGWMRLWAAQVGHLRGWLRAHCRRVRALP